MKKIIIIAVSIICTAFSTTKAQNILNKVPANASLVIKYAGNIFSQNMPIQKIDTYKFIRKPLLKILDTDSLPSIQNIGINLEQDTYQYITTDDSCTSFVTLLHLKNPTQFLQFLKTAHGSDIKLEKKNGFDFLSLSTDTYISWNETIVVIVNTHYQNRKYYYDYYRYDETSATVDSIVKTHQVILTDTATKLVKTKTPKTTLKKKTINTKKAALPKKKAPQQEIAENIETYKYHIQDSIQNARKSAWYKQQEEIAKIKQQIAAENIIANTFNSNIASIENELNYKKIIDPTAQASVWFNYETLLNHYWRYMYGDIYAMLDKKPAYTKDTTGNFKSAFNIYFEKDKIRIEQKTFSADPQLANMSKELMNSKQNTALVNYINPDNIGYLSISINTEAMANYCYMLLKKYFKNRWLTNEYADVVDAYIDLLQIMIDEKAIAELMPGNFLFVMHDMKTKTVTYKDYQYDKEFHYKEVDKTKQELSPNFTVIMETKRQDFLQRIAQLPVKYTKKEKFNYKDKGGYYELVFDSAKYPINSLYFIVKDGKAIVTTSKEVVNITLNNKSFTIDTDTKNSILNNNYSLKINTKKLIEQLSTEFHTQSSKKITDYLIQNLGNIKMESHFKDGMIQGTTTMSINGNHANSFEFLFDMMENIHNIIEKDRQEKNIEEMGHK